MTPDPGPEADSRWPSPVTVTVLVAAAYVLVWLFTLDASFTHDEVVYLDIAAHPFTSQFYPGDTFLRHPPLGLAMLAGVQALGVTARVWPLVLTLGGIGLLGAAVDPLDGSPASLVVPVLSAPALVPLTTVTLYPPLFFFLALAAWGWATDRAWVELVGWNLAVFTHELALLFLAVVLAVRAVRKFREGDRDVASWARLVWPYPAAVVWGSVMVWNLLAGTDARGGWVSRTLFDPSPELAAILGLKPFVSLVLLVALAPLVARPSRDDRTLSVGATIAAGIAVLASPFYRYAVAVVPVLVVLRADRPPAWWDKPGPALLVAACLLASGLSLGATVTGGDTLNAGGLPGLVDHEEAAELVEPGETVVVRSPPSFARALEDEGWRVAGTAPTGPATVTLARGGETIHLHRAATLSAFETLPPVDAAILPSTWGNVPDGIPGNWTPTDTADRVVRLEPSNPEG